MVEARLFFRLIKYDGTGAKPLLLFDVGELFADKDNLHTMQFELYGATKNKSKILLLLYCNLKKQNLKGRRRYIN